MQPIAGLLTDVQYNMRYGFSVVKGQFSKKKPERPSRLLPDYELVAKLVNLDIFAQPLSNNNDQIKEYDTPFQD